jgi:hypothetical protein
MNKMKILQVLTFCIGFLILLSVTGIGQTKAQKIALNKSISVYAAKTIKTLNNNNDSFKYKLTNRNIFYNDLDSDGEFDAIVELFFCERSSCHSTTNSSELVVFLLNRKGFTFSASKSFSLFGKVNSIKDRKIQIDVYDLDEDDPQCCPELKRHETYVLKNNKLVKVKK